MAVVSDEEVDERISRQITRRTKLLHATRGDTFTNETRQIARRAIELLFAAYISEDEQCRCYREMKWAIEELEEKAT